jgi:ketosteroid isomerase-like protein
MMKKVLVLIVFFLGSMAHGQAVNKGSKEGANAAVHKQASVQPLSSDEEGVWNGERNYFQYLNEKNLNGFLSLWDDNFVGWPDYSDRPLRKPGIEAAVKEEFMSGKMPSLPIPPPNPEAVGLFGDAAVTYYFWPEADESSPVRYRVMHTWQREAKGWYIIGGMSCEVPRFAPPAPKNSDQRPFTNSDDKSAVEATVRGYEEAVQQLDFPRADALLAPNAKWIERSMPEAAAMGEGAGFWAEAKATKVQVRNEPHDFDVHLQGEVAWVTLLVDVTMKIDNEKARRLLARSETEETGKASDPNQSVWRATYTESEVLLKTPNGWRIALGHTSRLPTN